MYDNFRKNAAMHFLAAFYTFNIVYLIFRGQARKNAFLLPNALASFRKNAPLCCHLYDLPIPPNIIADLMEFLSGVGEMQPL